MILDFPNQGGGQRGGGMPSSSSDWDDIFGKDGGLDLLGDKPSGGGGGWDDMFGGGMGGMMGGLGLLGAGGGLLAALFNQGGASGYENQLDADAKFLGSEGRELMSYMKKGGLPPGMEELFKNRLHGEQAGITQQAAKSGMGGDPMMNSALLQDLSSASSRNTAQQAQEAEKLYSQGVQMMGMSDQLYGMLEKMSRDRSAGLGKAIAAFAGALGRGAMTGGMF